LICRYPPTIAYGRLKATPSGTVTIPTVSMTLSVAMSVNGVRSLKVVSATTGRL
jgi:hypothetical protein